MAFSSLHYCQQPATAKTCCASICDVAPVGHRVERQCDNMVTSRLTAIRSLLDSTHCSASPQLSGLASSHHRKRSPCAGDYLWDHCSWVVSYWVRLPSARQGMLRVCALWRSLLIHLSIPITTHLHTGPIVAAAAHSDVVLGKKEISLLRRCACSGEFTHFEAAHSLAAERGHRAAG